MSSNSSPPSNKTIRCSHILLHRDGSLIPLVSVNDLTPITTVLPQLDFESGLTIVQDISLQSPPLCLPFLGMGPQTGKTNDPVSTEQETASSSAFWNRQCDASSCPSYTSSASSVIDQLRDAAQPRVLFPDITYPLPKTENPTVTASPLRNNSLFYIPPHSTEPTAPAPAQDDQTRLPAPTREPFRAFDSSKPCPPCISSGKYPWDTTCTSHHEFSAVKFGKSFAMKPASNGDDNDNDCDSLEEDNSAASIAGTQSSSSGENSIGGEDGSSIDDDTAPSAKGKKLRSTEPCTYFHRRVGCKRGKDCFYTHSKDGPTNTAGKYVPIKKPILTANNSKKLEGKWRRLEQPNTNDKGKNKEAIIDRNEGISKITCPTPGRTLSTTDPAKHVKTHCTFFLRFGECDYWPACKFSHERPEKASRWHGSKLLTGLKNGGSSSNEKEGAGNGSKDVAAGLEGISEKGLQSPPGTAGDPNPENNCREMTERVIGEEGTVVGQLISLAD